MTMFRRGWRLIINAHARDAWRLRQRMMQQERSRRARAELLASKIRVVQIVNTTFPTARVTAARRWWQRSFT